MDSSNYFAQFAKDDYALNILSQAATNTQARPDPHGMHQSPPARNVTQNVAELNYRGMPPRRPQSLVQHALDNSNPAPTPESRVSAFLGANHPFKGMDVPSFHPLSSPLARQQTYLNSGYQSPGSQLYGTSFGILNAETYDDGRGPVRKPQGRDASTRSLDGPAMPFGMVDVRVGEGDSDEEAGRKRKKQRHGSADEEDEAKKKARGRPRVDTKDETAADVRCI
jgi:hypothetical protein